MWLRHPLLVMITLFVIGLHLLRFEITSRRLRTYVRRSLYGSPTVSTCCKCVSTMDGLTCTLAGMSLTCSAAPNGYSFDFCFLLQVFSLPSQSLCLPFSFSFPSPCRIPRFCDRRNECKLKQTPQYSEEFAIFLILPQIFCRSGPRHVMWRHHNTYSAKSPLRFTCIVQLIMSLAKRSQCITAKVRAIPPIRVVFRKSHRRF